MRFQWGNANNLRNCRKQGLSFETAELVFDDPHALSVQDRDADGEERWQTIGRAADVVMLFVAHTIREDEADGETIRIISARKATARERQAYEYADR